jgi:hypothetical protein
MPNRGVRVIIPRMGETIRLVTTVLPGGRVEVDNADLAEGEVVDVLITPHVAAERRQAFVDYLKSLPSRRSPAEWRKLEEDLQAERDAWDC